MLTGLHLNRVTMAKKISRAEARELRLELLRARAAIERQNLRKYSGQVADDIAPGNLLKGLLPSGLGELGRGGAVDVLAQGAGLLARYPFLLSAFTGLLSRRGRSGRQWLGVVVGAVLGWQALRLVRQQKKRR